MKSAIHSKRIASLGSKSIVAVFNKTCPRPAMLNRTRSQVLKHRQDRLNGSSGSVRFSICDLCVIADALATWPAYFCLLPAPPSTLISSFFSFFFFSDTFISFQCDSVQRDSPDSLIVVSVYIATVQFGPPIATGPVLRCFVPLHLQPLLTVFAVCEQLHRHLVSLL